MTINADNHTRCTRCHSKLDGGWTTVHRDGEPVAVLCYACDKEELLARYLATGELTSSLVMTAVMAREHARHGFGNIRPEVCDFHVRNWKTLRTAAEANDEITAAGRRFEEAVWMPRLKAYYAASNRGHSGETGHLKALLWGCAGRVLLTLQDRFHQGHESSKYGGAWVTLIFDETSDEPRGGVQGYCATKGEALDLLRDATTDFPELKPDNGVRMF